MIILHYFVGAFVPKACGENRDRFPPFSFLITFSLNGVAYMLASSPPPISVDFLNYVA
jgi:hypothetical protein